LNELGSPARADETNLIGHAHVGWSNLTSSIR
jgi:hypothetical protein